MFREKDINDLCNSIIEMGGILVPLVVFRVAPNKYILLDGERRLRAAKKLKMEKVPANIVPSELPNDVNLATMFNIHMERVRWNPAARALALRHLKNLYKGISYERLSEITGMKKTPIKDAERILSFPSDLVERCLHEGQPDYLRPSNLVEMAKAFENIEVYLPDFFKKYERERVARILIKKRDEKIIPRNTDFRLIKDMLADLPPETAEQLIIKVIEEEETGISDVYESVQDQIASKRFDFFKRSCSKFLSILKDFAPENLDKKSQGSFFELLKQVRYTIDDKLRS